MAIVVDSEGEGVVLSPVTIPPRISRMRPRSSFESACLARGRETVAEIRRLKQTVLNIMKYCRRHSEIPYKYCIARHPKNLISK